MEIPDPSTEMAKQPEEQSISSEEKGGWESPEIDQVSQVGSTAYESVLHKHYHLRLAEFSITLMNGKQFHLTAIYWILSKGVK